MKKIISILLTACAVCTAFFCAGCGTNAKTENADGKLSIVTTIFPYYDFVRQLAGDRAEVKLLLSPGSEPHSYEPSPSDIVAIENCDLFIYNGGESDEWVEDVLSSADSEVNALKMTDCVTLLHEQSAESPHTEGDEYDEHVWTSLANAATMCHSISAELSKLDPNGKTVYSGLLEDYTASLAELDEKFRDVVNSKKRDTLVFGDRFPFLYFVTDYGLNYECAFPGCSSETEPSTATVSHLIDFTRDNDIPAVFYLELSSGNIARIISEDSNAEAMRFSSCHNVSKEDFENGATYISVMEENLQALKEALC